MMTIPSQVAKAFETLNLISGAWNILLCIIFRSTEVNGVGAIEVLKATGMSKSTVYRILASLEEKNIIASSGGRHRVYRLNPSCEDWRVSKTVPQEQEDISKGLPKTKSPHIMTEGFQRFLTVYPVKLKVMDAVVAWNNLNPSKELEDKIIESVERFKRTKQWKENKGKFIPYPVNFLNDQRWLDKVEEEVDWQTT